MPSSPYTGHANQAKHDIESSELRKKKRIKCLAYVAAFSVFQTGIILIFTMTIMKVRTPKFRIRSASFESFQVGTTAQPSFELKMDAQVGVKNANFGAYKFQNSSIVFLYGDTPVGHADVQNSKAGWRSTKKLHVVVELSSNALPASNSQQLGNDIKAGELKLRSQSMLDGKVKLMFIFKKKKSTNMNCTLTVGVADKAVTQITCK